MSAARPHSSASGSELVERLLAFEDRLEVLEPMFAPERIALWPLVRFRVFETVLQQAAGQPLRDRSAAPRAAGLGQRARRLAAVLRHDPLRIARRFELVILGSGAGISAQRDGRWFDRINDYFALEHEAQSLVISASPEGVVRAPRYPRHTAALDALPLRAAARARLAGRPSSAHARAIEQLARLLREKLPLPLWPQFDRDVLRHLTALAVRLRFLRDGYLRLFERTRPGLVFLEDASYGGQAYVLECARSLGIRTGEFQHGMIAKTHVAYNYGPELRASALYRRYVPEFLLTYGRFWSDATRTASRLVAIGHPHFEARRAELGAMPQRSGRRFVIVSQPDLAGLLVPLALELRAGLASEDELVYRLHPDERAAAADFAALRARTDIKISDRGDSCGLLHGADGAIGCFSTVLLQAAGLGCPTYVYETAATSFCMPRGFGTWFANAGELLFHLRSPDRAPDDPDRYFRPNWRAAYREFLETYASGPAYAPG